MFKEKADLTVWTLKYETASSAKINAEGKYVFVRYNKLLMMVARNVCD